MEEAETSIFFYLQPAAIAESSKLAEHFKGIAEQIGDPARPVCFLVANDLSSIDAFLAHYQFHQIWNTYSPFESMPESTIAELEEL